MLPLADKNVQIFRPTFVLPRPSQPGLARTELRAWAGGAQGAARSSASSGANIIIDIWP